MTKVDSEKTINSIVTLSVESWRFSKVFEKIISKLSMSEQAKYGSQLRWFNKKVEESLVDIGLKVINIEGHPYDPGIAATPLNLQEFNEEDNLFVEQMIEPIIMGQNGIVKTGTVILKKVES